MTDKKEVIRRAWENRKAEWPMGAERYYVHANAPIVPTWTLPTPDDLTRPVQREETVVEFRRERSINRQGGYYAARIVGTFKGEELTVEQWMLPQEDTP